VRICAVESSHTAIVAVQQFLMQIPNKLRALASFLPLVLTGIAFACSDTANARQCTVGAECASGQCSSEGKCVGTQSQDGAVVGDASRPDAAAMTDATPASDASSDASSCEFAGGSIARADIPFGPNLRANYRSAASVDVDTRGTAGAGGVRTWDFSGVLTGDQTIIVETLPLTGTWYAAKFPSASYVSKLSASSDLLGVFEAGAGSLSLLGIVSPMDGQARTELKYAPPAEILSFPLQLGKKFKTSNTVTGTYPVGGFGTTVAYTEAYDSEVDAEGRLKTPLGTFGVLRVNTLLTKTVGLLVTKVRTHLYVTKCFGSIATVVSTDGEAQVEFSRASQMRRISP
jgi:hypothetical protein